MSDTIRIPYCWPWWMRLLALLLTAALLWFTWRVPDHGIGIWIARIFGLFFFGVAAVSGETVMDPHRRQIRRVWKLFGVVPVFDRTFLFDAVRQVRWRRACMEGEVDSQHSVELVLKNGRTLILTTFLSYEQARTCGDANALALQVAECLGLPFTSEPDRM